MVVTEVFRHFVNVPSVCEVRVIILMGNIDAAGIGDGVIVVDAFPGQVRGHCWCMSGMSNN